MPVSRGKKGAFCHFLVDTGAQFSIINKEFAEQKVGPCLSPPLSRLVSSFGMPTAVREGFNYVADLTLPCGTKTFNVFFEWKISICQLKSIGCPQLLTA